MDRLFASNGAHNAAAAAMPLDSPSSSSTPNFIDPFVSPMAVISVVLQYGSQREKVILERSERPEAYNDFTHKAQQLVERAIDEGHTPWPESAGELLLFRHDYRSANMLQRLTNIKELDNGSVVEIIRVSGPEQQKVSSPHCVHVTSFRTPTFCDYCGEMILGLIKQGTSCAYCHCNFHKKCAHSPGNNCAKNETITQQPTNAAAATTAGGAPAQGATAPKLVAYELPHTLIVTSYRTPTVCKVCDKLLLGLVKQGMKCRDCKVNVHRKCAALLGKDCRVAENGIVPQLDQMSMGTESASSGAGGGGGLGALASLASVMDVEASGSPTAAASSCDVDMIPLARLPGSATGRSQYAVPTCEGWMIHFLLSEPSRRLKNYWILANGAISMYNEYNDGVNPSRVFRQIALSDIMAIAPYEGPPIDERFPAHCFEIRVRNANAGERVFCVGENLQSLAASSAAGAFGAMLTTSRLPRAYPPNHSHAWYCALQQALQPPPLRTDPRDAEPALQFTNIYQIARERVLGSGQFGTVFHGIHRQSGREVAVKVIAKDRFSKKSSGVETLKSEVTILQTIDHPGIIKLESMFETKDKVFVVMERMNGDISLSIDLEPENVLLSDLNTSFPQTKLCDFGYARVIGDAQFRRTIVGTPAYMAPELLMKKGYNKSLDMWSTGVILYVTLSGTFPFNDGEEIPEQIQNAAFMFPPDLWQNTSRLAIDLIQKLLKVEIEQRLNIDECIAHPFFQHDAQLYSDLRQLELRLPCGRYLTSEADDQRYAGAPVA